MSKPIYLYVKQCQHCGLKYFGKTATNPYKYKGSGTYWCRHLDFHRPEISTLEVYGFDDIDLCTSFALKFSRQFDIVKSKDWANLREENGLDGGNCGPSGIEKMRKALKGRPSHLKGKSRNLPIESMEKIRAGGKKGAEIVRNSPEKRAKISKALMGHTGYWKGKSKPKEINQMTSKTMSNKIWVYKGRNNRRINSEDLEDYLNQGFLKGRSNYSRKAA